MTDDEARDLVPGQLVEARVGGVWREVKVLALLGEEPARPRLLVRRTGYTRGGTRFPPLRRYPVEVRPHPADLYDHLPANVFADWLEERGQAEAARMLRAAFPLADGKETPE
jgi:uncharacterized protein (TIGR02996 family)